MSERTVGLAPVLEFRDAENQEGFPHTNDIIGAKGSRRYSSSVDIDTIVAPLVDNLEGLDVAVPMNRRVTPRHCFVLDAKIGRVLIPSDDQQTLA